MTKIGDHTLCMRKADLKPIEAFPAFMRPTVAATYAKHAEGSCASCGETIVFDSSKAIIGLQKVCVHCLGTKLENQE